MILFPYFILLENNLRSKEGSELDTSPKTKAGGRHFILHFLFPTTFFQIFGLSTHRSTLKMLNQSLERKVILTTCRHSSSYNVGLAVLGTMPWGGRLQSWTDWGSKPSSPPTALRPWANP